MPTYYVRGSKAKVVLEDRDFIAAGGEKKVYAKGGTAYCVYHEPAAAIPAAKIRELAALSSDSVVVPTAELLDANKQHVGEVMAFVADSYSPFPPNAKPMVLCQLITNAFRRKQKVENRHIADVTNRILDITRYCHSKGAVLVDPNDANWLVRHDLGEVYLIDTSCIQTASYPGTAIKPAIRDWTVSHFDQNTDWFSIAVVLGWLWVGIHPYMAEHPRWKGFTSAQALEPRVRENWSFFRSGTEFNRACRPIADVPTALRDWLRAVLDEGQRCPGPTNCGTPAPTAVRVVVPAASSHRIELKELETFAADVRTVFGQYVTTDSNYPDAVIATTPRFAMPVAAQQERSELQLYDYQTGLRIPLSAHTSGVFLHGNRIYVAGQTTVSEVVFNELTSGEIRATLRRAGSIADLPTTRAFPGCVIQNLLGKYLLSRFPESGKCLQRQLPELAGWQILDASCISNVLVVAAEQGGDHLMLMYRFADDNNYDCTPIAHEHGDVNFAVTDRGITAAMLPNGNLRLCHSRMGSISVQELPFPEPDMALFARDSRIVGALGKSVYAVNLS